MTIDCSPNWSEISQIGGPYIRPGGSVLTGRALEVCNLSPGSRIADIGCGAGGTLEYLERTGFSRSVGLDYSETLLGEAVPRLVAGQLVRGRAETLPFRKDSFDALFCECVLSILGERKAALREFTRVLRERGFLVISDVFGRVGAGQGPAGTGSQRVLGTGLLRKEDLFTLLTSLGFSILLWEEHERFLKEFAARMILGGASLSDLWTCKQEQDGMKADCSGISYFLLVALKAGGHS